MAQISPDLKRSSDVLTDPEASDDDVRAAVEQYVEVVQRLGTAAEILDFQALGKLANFVTQNVLRLADGDPDTRRQVGEPGLLDQWVLMLGTYFQCPDEAEVHEQMAEILGAAEWPVPADPALCAEIVAGLAKAPGAIPAQALKDESGIGAEATAPVDLSEDDVSLVPAPDVNPELLDAFLQEVLTQAANLSSCVEHITSGQAGAEELRQAMRLAHTLKGSASLVGVRGVANLTHYVEDILERLREHEDEPPSAELSDVLMEASDCLEMMAEAVLGIGEPPVQALDVMERVRVWAAQRAPAMKPRREPVEEREPPSNVPTMLAVSTFPALRVPVEVVDDMMRIGGETTINVGLVQSHLADMLTAMAGLHQQNLLIQQRVFDLENLIDIRGIPENRVAAIADGGGRDDDFDPLELDQYNELHSLSRQFVEAITDAREMSQDLRDELVGIQNMLVQQERLNRELNDKIITARMISVNNLLPRLRRTVRQTARTTGKKVDLSIEGGDLMIDTEILTALSEPLMHGLRNAVDHGIESAAQRAAAGKPETGRITLDFVREGHSVTITLRDDGCGLDYDTICRVARDKGLIQEREQPDIAQLIRMIFTPGFSTLGEATEVSGRGIGMDIIGTAVDRLKGTLEVASRPGEGLELRMRLPVTLVSVHVLFVRIGERIFAVPSTSVEQLLFPETGALTRGEDGYEYRYGDEPCPAASLQSLLGMEDTLDDGIPRPVLLIRGDSNMHAVVVDQALESREVVVKSLGPYLPNIRGVGGACIRPDGSVAPLLDLRELLRTPGSFEAAIRADELAEPERRARARNALIVEDSLSARRALVLLVTGAGFESRTAIDGLEAIAAIEEKLPDIILVDLEMPRMNGLELTAHLRAQDATREIPVIMVTSRSTEKHRKQAEAAGVTAYVTKPFVEDELLALIRTVVVGS